MHPLLSAILIFGLSACARGEDAERVSEASAREARRQRAATPECSADSAWQCLPQRVSLASLLVRPEDYDGKRVQVMGFAHFEFESNGLYLHRDDAEHGIDLNGLWMDPPYSPGDSLRDHYVMVEGTFDAQNKGHLGMWSGAIVKVTRAVRWPPSATTK